VPNQKHYARHSGEGLFWEDAAAPIAVSAPVARRLPAATISKEAEAKAKEDDELKRAMALVKTGDEFEVRELLGKIETEFGCQERKAESIWKLMRDKGDMFEFVKVSPGKYRCEEPKPF